MMITKIVWLVLLADYSTLRIYKVFQFIKYIVVAKILILSEVVDLTTSLGMQCSVIMTSEDHSTKIFCDDL